MKVRIYKEQIVNRLLEQKIVYKEMSLSDGFSLIACERGGRLFGPFVDNGESVLWSNHAFQTDSSFDAFIKSGDWNIGGDRIWVAPEFQYNVRDRNRFFETYAMQNDMDPGNYDIIVKTAGLVLEKSMHLEVYTQRGVFTDIFLKREVLPLTNPLRCLSSFDEVMRGVSYAGYIQKLTLKQSKFDGLINEVWNLTQAVAGGKLYVGTTGCPEYTDYYTPVDELQTWNNRRYILDITGERIFKVGYKASGLTGRYAYLNELEEGRWCLMVKNYFNDPSGEYIKEPSHMIGCKGHSMHIYQDDGKLGGVAEFEISGTSIGDNKDNLENTTSIHTWYYAGSKDSMEHLLELLL
jgi:hypothetical protein